MLLNFLHQCYLNGPSALRVYYSGNWPDLATILKVGIRILGFLFRQSLDDLMQGNRPVVDPDNYATVLHEIQLPCWHVILKYSRGPILEEHILNLNQITNRLEASTERI